MEKELRRIFRKYRKQIVPIALCFAAFFIVMRVVIPQWEETGILRSQLEEKTTVVDELRAGFNLLQSTPDQTIEDNFNLAVKALPYEKSIITIFNFLNESAEEAGVSLGSFNLRVGGVYDTRVDGPSDATIEGIPVLGVQIRASGSVEQLREFGNILYNSLPIVEVTKIAIGRGEGTFDINLFYQPLAAANEGPAKLKNELAPLTPQETEVLKQLQEWSN